MFSPKERLKKTINNEKVDRAPVICPGGMMNMVTTQLLESLDIDFSKAHSDSVVMANLAKAVYDSGCFENYGLPFCMTIEAEDFGAKVDMGSNIYEPHVTEYFMNSVSDWKSVKKIDFEKGRSKTVIEAIKILKSNDDGVPIIGNVTGPISTASSIMEPVIFYKELRKKSKDAHDYMEFITNELIDFSIKQIEAGADIIAISDPSGTGEILGPKLFDEYVVKYINKLVESIHKNNANTIVHICGRMHNVYKEVDKIKSDVLSFDSIVSMKEARENLDSRVLMGNVSTYAIEFSEVEKIKELTIKCLENGSNIISPACGLGMKSPLENVKAISNALKGV